MGKIEDQNSLIRLNWLQFSSSINLFRVQKKLLTDIFYIKFYYIYKTLKMIKNQFEMLGFGLKQLFIY